MTRRRLLITHLRGVAINAIALGLKLHQLFFDCRDLWISNSLIVLVTSSADSDRHIRGHSHQRAATSDVDVTGSAFLHVLSFAAFVTKFGGDSFRPDTRNKSLRWFMTAAAVVARRLLILPVTVEAQVMTVRHPLESKTRWFESIGRAVRRYIDERIIRDMADRAVVVVSFLVLVNGEGSLHHER